MTKRTILFTIAAVCLFAVVLVFISQRNTDLKEQASSVEKIKIVATLFPQYDFAKQVAKERAIVALLLPPGVESHTYEPSPSDIEKIIDADMFIYTGKYMEQWAGKIIAGIKNKDLIVVDVSENIDLSKPGEDEILHESEAKQMEEHDVEEEHEGHSHLFDPHIWTDPNNAMIMTENILSALCAADPKNADFYKDNAEVYKNKLAKLDKDFKDAVASGKRKEVVFGGRNAFHYFVKRYGLKCIAANDSCSTEAEASVRKVAELMDKIREDDIPVIYYEEITAPKIANAISSETGVKMLQFNSCHNVTKEEVEKGETYVSLMEQNLKNLKEGLK